MPDIVLKCLTPLAALFSIPWALVSIAVKRESFIFLFVNMKPFQ